MDGFAYSPRSGVLFAEDFDLPQMAPEPEVIEPTFSATDLTAARETAWQEGHEAGRHEAVEHDAVATRQAIAAMAQQLAEERGALVAQAEQSAEAIARLLLDSLAAVFPTLCARYGDAEVRAVIRAVLPALAQEAAITVRAHPRTLAAVEQEIARLNPDLAQHVQTIECDAMSPGDVRVAWHSGSAVRDATTLWEQVAGVLMPAGLLRADAMIRETFDAG